MTRGASAKKSSVKPELRSRLMMNRGSPILPTATEGPLPKFDRPPVIEVALSVQFGELPNFQPIHFGLLWNLWQDRFSRFEHHPPLPSTIENFDPSEARGVSVEVKADFPIGRYWFLDSSAQRVLQIQPDRLIYNWRRILAGDAYPSYDRLRADLEKELSLFCEFVEQNKLGTVEPTQAELTYVNEIGPGALATNETLSRLTPLWSGHVAEEVGLPEDIRVALRYRREHEGKPVGRLHVDIRTAKSEKDTQQVLLMQLTGRGAPLSPNIEGVMRLTDLAHDWIVRGFAALTTPIMHDLWKRTA